MANIINKAEGRPARHRGVELFTVLFIIIVALSFVRKQVDVFSVCSDSKSIYTVDESNPTVQCITVQDSRIAGVGSLRKTWAFLVLNGIKQLRRPKIFYLKPGSIIVPGLTDAHAHIMEYGWSRQLPLENAKSVNDVRQLVRQYIEAHPDMRNDPSRWIEGMGWDQTKWDIKEFPTAADLDQDSVLRGRPIVLTRVDGHASWVSTRVLELMAPLPSSVPGGIIQRDAKGKPTGILLDNAMDLITKPAMTQQQMELYFNITLNDALRYGLTSIHDAASIPEAIAFFKVKAEKDELPIRLYAMGWVPSSNYSAWENKFPRLLDYGVRGRLNVRAVKLFADGALGSWGAALLEPYSDKPQSDGIMRFDAAELTNLMKALWHADWQVNVHCIGDRANRIVLDIFQDLTQAQVTVTARRPRIEHAQIVAPEDVKRFGTLGVIPSVQPTHATSDMWYAETRLGTRRIRNAYAYQTMLQASRNVLPLGSDFPVEGVNPLLGFYAAVSRLSVTGTSPHGAGGWYPEEALTRTQALKGMTLDAAYASFAENELGSLQPGKKADFVILDRDIMRVPLPEILQTQVLATVVDGKIEYGSF